VIPPSPMPAPPTPATFARPAAPQPTPAGDVAVRVEPPTPAPAPTASGSPARRSAVPVTLSRQPPATPAPPVAPTRAGFLQLLILPWAEVRVDGQAVGTTPLKPIRLAVGEHSVELRHPAYVPLRKTVTVRLGETTKLEVDLSFEAFPR